MELSSMKICAAIPTSRALPEVVRRMPRKRISGLEWLLQQDPTMGPWEMEKELIFSPWRVFLKLLILSVSAVRGGAAQSRGWLQTEAPEVNVATTWSL
nr:uncharacterized protein LOC101138784 [Gorilla gorilla gorilla]XP_055217141.1 uncharacterized protein LOC101138784 [Gorilla gorilla gorilla]